jgi:O-antigen/teichoic acid export membrane protein
MDFIIKQKLSIGRLLPVLKASGAITIGDSVYSLSVFISSAIVARTLGTADFGLYSVFLATVFIANQVADLGLTNGLVKYGALNKNNKEEQSAGFIAGLRGKLIAAISVQVVGVFGLLFFWHYEWNTTTATFLGLIAGSGLSANYYIRSVLQATEKFYLLAIYSAAPGIIYLLTVLVFTLSHLLSLNLLWMTYSAIYLFFFILGLIVLPVYTTKKQLSESWEILWKFSKWLFMSGLIYQAIDRLTLFIVALKSGNADAGIYSSAFQLALGLSLFSGALQKVFLPKVSAYKTVEQFELYLKQLVRMIPLLIGIWLVLLLLSGSLIRLFFGSAYQAAQPIFYIISISYLIRLVIWPMGLVIWSYNKQSYLTLMNFVQLLVMAFLTWLLTPTWGVVGTAIAFTLSDGLLTVTVVPLFVRSIIRYERKQEYATM